MNVKNRKCIRKLSLKSLYANRRRNLIAIFAIALTTLLFTSMFTIVLSLNASYETVACHAKRKKLTRKTKKTLLNTTFKSVFYYL